MRDQRKRLIFTISIGGFTYYRVVKKGSAEAKLATAARIALDTDLTFKYFTGIYK